MANDLTKNPMVIDTAAATVLWSDPIKIKSIRWVSKSATAGDDIEIQDSNNQELWVSVASGANYSEEVIIERWWHEGFKVPTLDSGTLYISYL
jgi:hypothetical protein